MGTSFHFVDTIRFKGSFQNELSSEESCGPCRPRDPAPSLSPVTSWPQAPSDCWRLVSCGLAAWTCPTLVQFETDYVAGVRGLKRGLLPPTPAAPEPASAGAPPAPSPPSKQGGTAGDPGSRPSGKGSGVGEPARRVPQCCGKRGSVDKCGGSPTPGRSPCVLKPH